MRQDARIMIAQQGLRPPGVAAFDAAEVLVALFRRWAWSRNRGVNPMPAMMRLVEGSAYDWTLVPACDSFFALSESCLGRPLSAGPDAAPDIAPREPFLPDEIGLIATVVQCPPADGAAVNAGIPHGLPAALCWAAQAVRRALGQFAAVPADQAVEQCPFPHLAGRDGLDCYPRPPLR